MCVCVCVYGCVCKLVCVCVTKRAQLIGSLIHIKTVINIIFSPSAAKNPAAPFYHAQARARASTFDNDAPKEYK